MFCTPKHRENNEFISKQPCILCLCFFVSPVQIQCSACYSLFLPFAYFLIFGYFLQALDNLNSQ